MAKTPFELHVSVYQYEDLSLHWNVYYRHHSRDQLREGHAVSGQVLDSLEASLSDVLDTLCYADGSPLLPTIRLRRTTTPGGGLAPTLF
jgi:hypothetical protein